MHRRRSALPLPRLLATCAASLIALSGCAMDAPSSDVSASAQAVTSAPVTGSFTEHDVVVVGSTTRSDGTTVLTTESVLVFRGWLSGRGTAHTEQHTAVTGASTHHRVIDFDGYLGREPIQLRLGVAAQGTTQDGSGTFFVLNDDEAVPGLLGDGSLEIDSGMGTFVIEPLPLALQLSIAYRNDLAGNVVFARLQGEVEGAAPSAALPLRLTLSTPNATSFSVDRVEVRDAQGGELLALWDEGAFVLEGTEYVPDPDPADNIIVPLADAPTGIDVYVWVDGLAYPYHSYRDVVDYDNDTPSGSYGFPGRALDLDEGEYWVGSLGHASLSGSQRFGFDLQTRAWDGSEWSKLVPGGNASVPEDYLVYGMPVYAMAAGTIIGCERDIPNNPNASVDQDPPGVNTAGNFLKIQTGDEVTLYAHMQEHSIPEGFCDGTVTMVQEGDLLGLVGNTGTAGPHLHIHIQAASTARMRPLLFHGADVVAIDSIEGPNAEGGAWIALDGYSLPDPGVLIRPGNAPIRCMGQLATITGTSGNDWLLGTNGDDVIIGGQGNDVIYGYDGDDVICGGRGDDEIFAGTGADVLRGEQGADLIDGENDDDDIDGGLGNDALHGGLGHDVVEGGDGDDTLFGDTGFFVLSGNDDDTLRGATGDHEIDGEDGDDLLEGGDGTDILEGDLGADTLDGNDDTDWCDGGADSDVDTAISCEGLHSIP